MARASTSSGFTAEFQLCLSLLAPELEKGGKSDRLKVDWTEFIRLVEFHQVLDVVVPRLRNKDQVPKWVLERLEMLLRMKRMQRLRHFALLSKISDTFEEAGIGFIVLKGPVVGQWLWGQPCGRHFKDLDLLVSESQIQNAIKVMSGLGLRQDPSIAEIEWFHWSRRTSLAQHFTLIGPGGECVELHWRISFQGAFRSFSYIEKQSKVWLLDNLSVLSPKESVLSEYLLEHGNRHFWFRLKWLVDAARLIEMKGQGYVIKNGGRSSRLCFRLLDRLGLVFPEEERGAKKRWNFHEYTALRLIKLARVEWDILGKISSRVVRLMEYRPASGSLQSCFWELVPGRFVFVFPLPKWLWFLYLPLAPFAALAIYLYDYRRRVPARLR